MKYKYTRKECNKEIETIKRIFSGSQIMPGGWLETVTQYLHATQLMLLAQKEDKKECKCEEPDYETIINPRGLNKNICRKCGKELKSTPSPLEIEEIEEIETCFKNYNDNEEIILTIHNSKLLINKINTLIRNQKKLYQLIKEKL